MKAQSSIGDHRLPSSHGGNQVTVGQYNERLVISLLRRHGRLTKAELARLTGLSAQTMTVIVKRLMENDLLVQGDKQRGKVGQPSTPFGLNPRGAVSIGIKIGRRSLDMMVMGFDGSVIERRADRFAIPDAASTLTLIRAGLPELIAALPSGLGTRILGAGIAMPRTLSGWEDEMNLPAGALAGWSDIDIVAEIEAMVQAPTYLLHDVSAACLAELCFGVGKDIQNFFYIYIGSFVGGGLVLSNQLQTGAHGSAASIGSLPTSLSMDGGATGEKAAQLIERASLTGFEAMARAAGHDDPHAFYYGDQDASTRALFSQWAVDAADSLAFAVTVTAAVLDLDAVVIAGGLPHDRVAELVALTHERLPRYNTKGLHLPQIHQAAIGIDARALGGAFAPIYTHFSLERNALLIEG